MFDALMFGLIFVAILSILVGFTMGGRPHRHRHRRRHSRA